MLNIDKIQEINQQSRRDKWPYPKTFEALKEAGVESYIVYLDSLRITYQGNQEEWQDSHAPEDFTSFKINSSFNQEKLIQDLRSHQHGKTTYLEFIQDMADAGVCFYEVQMQQRTVTYFSGDKRHFYQEHVPELSGS